MGQRAHPFGRWVEPPEELAGRLTALIASEEVAGDPTPATASDGLRLSRALVQISSPAVRAYLVDLAESLASNEDCPGSRVHDA